MYIISNKNFAVNKAAILIELQESHAYVNVYVSCQIQT